MMFDEEKISQMAAFFLMHENRRMSHLKLMKLLYLSDRASLNRYGFPISGDQCVAMPHGPVLTNTLNLISGDMEGNSSWQSWISGKADYQVGLKKDNVQDITDLDLLSEADISILQEIWGQFGHMTKWQIRDYTHDHCSEWTDPNGSSRPIPYRDIFIALGKTPDIAAELEKQIEQQHQSKRSIMSI